MQCVLLAVDGLPCPSSQVLMQTAEAKFKDANAAYATLSDPIERRTYDLTKPWAGSSGTGSRSGFPGGAGPNSATDDERIREWAAKMGYTVNTSQSEFYKQYNDRPEASTQASFAQCSAASSRVPFASCGTHVTPCPAAFLPAPL